MRRVIGPQGRVGRQPSHALPARTAQSTFSRQYRCKRTHAKALMPLSSLTHQLKRPEHGFSASGLTFHQSGRPD